MAALLAGLIVVAVAQAGKGVVEVIGSSGAADGQFNEPRDVAVNEATGDAYDHRRVAMMAAPRHARTIDSRDQRVSTR